MDKVVVGQIQQVGALFEALNERVLMAPSDLPFFAIQTILHEHCAHKTQTPQVDSLIKKIKFIETLD